ncbi:MAG: HEAT repeat domain-containing protein [Vicinamibacterales bacterium]
MAGGLRAAARGRRARGGPALSLLDGDGQITRGFALRGLATLKHAAALPAITALATGADQPLAVRIRAVRAMAAIGQPASAEPLMAVASAASVDPNPSSKPSPRSVS